MDHMRSSLTMVALQSLLEIVLNAHERGNEFSCFHTRRFLKYQPSQYTIRCKHINISSEPNLLHWIICRKRDSRFLIDYSQLIEGLSLEERVLLLLKHCVLHFLVFYHKVEKYASTNSMTFDEAKVNKTQRHRKKTSKDHQNYEKQTPTKSQITDYQMERKLTLLSPTTQKATTKFIQNKLSK